MERLLKATWFFAIIISVVLVPSSTFALVANDSQAAVVIDTGKEVKTACITFQGDSISGAEALELANADPKFQAFGSTGKAVCSLCGVGCPVGNSCLTCMGSTFWNYFRSAESSPGFTLSGVGAGSSSVRDGDVEGWKFGVGQKPPYLSFNTICGIKVENQKPNTVGEVKSKNIQYLEQESNSTNDSNLSKDTNSEVKGAQGVKVLGKTESRASRPRSSDLIQDEGGRSAWLQAFLYSMVFIGLMGVGSVLFLNSTKKQKL